LIYLIVIFGAMSVWFSTPGRVLDRGDWVYVTLAILVFTAGLTVDVGNMAHVRRHRWRILLALVVPMLLLPLLAWSLSLLVDGPQREALLALGVAPSEVATLALVGLAAGDVVTAALMLFGSTLFTIVAAGPLLSLVASTRGTVVNLHPLVLAGTLTLVVALPLALGVVLGHRMRASAVARDLSELIGLAALLTLIVEVASQMHLELAYLLGIAALIMFIIGASLIGMTISIGTSRSLRSGIVLPVAIRDFAVAAGIATAAFGVSAVGLLGIYGLIVLMIGSLSVRYLGRST
jgi:BASS family bile acid:Na+ symporter